MPLSMKSTSGLARIQPRHHVPAPHKGQEYCVEEWLTLDAPKSSSSYQRTAEGKGRVKQILSAYDEQMPDKIEPRELIAALEGKAVRIAVTHKITNDLPVPKVSRILGKPQAPPT